MERSKLKDIVRSLELMVDALKTEVYSDVDSYKMKHPHQQDLTMMNCMMMVQINE